MLDELLEVRVAPHHVFYVIPTVSFLSFTTLSSSASKLRPAPRSPRNTVALCHKSASSIVGSVKIFSLEFPAPVVDFVLRFRIEQSDPAIILVLLENPAIHCKLQLRQK